jgi:hypothetical protein
MKKVTKQLRRTRERKARQAAERAYLELGVTVPEHTRGSWAALHRAIALAFGLR